jgi:hypothetical protein
MLLLAVVLILLSSLSVASTVSKHVEWIELLDTTAVTADLSLLNDIQADMTKFRNSARTLYTKYFFDNHIGTSDLALGDSLQAEIRVVHDYLFDLFGSTFDLDNSACAFAPYVVGLCKESTPRLGALRTALQSEVLRTHRCATTVSRVHFQINRLRGDYLGNTSYFMSLQRGFQPTVAYSFRIPQKVNLDQTFELQTRFLEFWEDLQELEMLTLKLPTMERIQYLQGLELLYRTAGSDASTALSMGEPHLRDDYRLMENYWSVMCHNARDSLAETYESKFSSWKTSAETVAEQLVSRGQGFVAQWI